MATKGFTVKLTVTEALALDQVVTRCYYRSRSDAIRAALRLLFDQYQIKPEARVQMLSERRAATSRRNKQAMEAGVPEIG